MSQTLKIGILRGRHDTAALALTPALDQACKEMLVESAYPKREAVLEYWTDNTDGVIQFTATIFPWVDVTFGSADANNKGQISRATQLDKIKAATGIANLSAFDGFMCLVAPGAPFANPQGNLPGQPAMFSFDGGTTGHGHGAASVYPLATSDHTFMCHEFGHVLGLFDDDGIPWNYGGTITTGYGDPLDIMAAEAFAGQKPVFQGTAVANWPNAEAKKSMGPAPSRAIVHYWNADAQRKTLVKTVTAGDNAPPVRLYAAYVDAGAPRLLVLEPDVPQNYSVGRTYLEYRDVRKWDRGLKTAGPTMDRRSVVAHVAALRPLPDLGAGDTIGNRCFYRGQIVIPVEIDSDLQIAGTPFTVRVLDADLDEAWVELKLTRSSPQGFEIERIGSDDISGPAGPIEEVHTPCGDTMQYGTWFTVGRYAFRPVVWGLGGTGAPSNTPQAPPIVVWQIGGITLAAGLAKGTLVGCKSPQGSFNVDFVLDATGTLHLNCAPGQAYTMPVAATATHAATGASVTAQSSYEPKGQFHGYPWSDVTRLVRCLQRIVAVFPPDVWELRPPPDQPRPEWLEIAELVIDRSRTLDASYASAGIALERLVGLIRRPLARDPSPERERPG